MCSIDKFCLPQMQKCCFYLPLKKGLLAWGYLKLVFHVLLMFYALLLVIRFIQLEPAGVVIMLILFTFIIIDIIMNVLFLKSLQQDKYNLLTAYYYYILVLLILYAITFLILTVIKMIRDGELILNWPYMLQDCVIGCGNCALQLYLSELVKSHVHNLKFGIDPEIQSLYNKNKEDREEEKHRDKYSDNKDDHDHDTDDSGSEVDSEKKHNEPGHNNEEVTPKTENEHTELAEIH